MLIGHIQKNENAAGHRDGEAKHIDKYNTLVAENTAVDGAYHSLKNAVGSNVASPVVYDSGRSYTKPDIDRVWFS